MSCRNIQPKDVACLGKEKTDLVKFFRKVSTRYKKRYPYFIIDSQRRDSRMGPLRSGLRCGTDGLGQCRSPRKQESVQMGAKQALVSNVCLLLFKSNRLPILQVNDSSTTIR